MAKKADGYLIQQRFSSDEDWVTDSTEYPLDSIQEARNRLRQLKDDCPESEWRARPFTLCKTIVHAPK